MLSLKKDKPLSFLDHHIKIGDSLVGAKIKEIGKFPRKRKFGIQELLFKGNEDFEKTVKAVVDKIMRIENIETNNIDDIGIKKELLEKINEKLKPYKSICNYHYR